MIRIEGVDDLGVPSGTVSLFLPSESVRTLTALELETGTGAGLSGALGRGSGKWQLTVSSDSRGLGVVNLLSSPSGHLTNLSGAPSDDFDAGKIDIGRFSLDVVKPLEKIRLAMYRFERVSDLDYTVELDLSGTGAFEDEDIMEVTGLSGSTDGDIVFSAPVMQLMAPENASGRFAARVRRNIDHQLSNTLYFTVEEIRTSDVASGYPTTMWEIIQKATATHVDDELLNIKAEDLNPGQVVELAKRLGVEPTYSDVLAEAVFGALFGVSVVDIIDPIDKPVIADAAHGGPAAVPALQPKFSVINYFNELIGDCIVSPIGDDEFVEGCTQRVGPEVNEAWGQSHEEITSIAGVLSRLPRLRLRRGVSEFIDNANEALVEMLTGSFINDLTTGLIENTRWIGRPAHPDPGMYSKEHHFYSEEDQSALDRRGDGENYERLHEASRVSVENQRELNESAVKFLEEGGSSPELTDIYRSLVRRRHEQAAYHDELKAAGLSHITQHPDDVGLEPPDTDPDPSDSTGLGNDESTLCVINATAASVGALSDPDVECEDVGTEQEVQGSVAGVSRYYVGLGWVRLGGTLLWRWGEENLGLPPFDSGECEILVDPVIDNGLRGKPLPSLVGFLLICPADPDDNPDGSDTPAGRPPPVTPPSPVGDGPDCGPPGPYASCR